MFTVKVPATSANLGPGFDSIGMALSLYNSVSFEESESELEIISLQNDINIPLDKTNLIYETVVYFYDLLGYKNIPNLKIVQDDRIPLTRGLGSSAACIVAGLLAANKLSGANLPKEEISYIAAKIEGHPDNTTPAINGGVIVGVLTEEKLDYIKIDIKNPEKIKFAVMIPDFALSTNEARAILPKTYSISDAVFNISRASLLIAALMSGDFEKLNTAVDDRLHQPYRKNIICNMDEIFKKANELGALGSFLSGAGPTLISLVEEDAFFDKMGAYLKSIDGGYKIHNISMDIDGALLNENVKEEKMC